MRLPGWFRAWLDWGETWIVDIVLILLGTGFVIGGLAMWKSEQPIPNGVMTTGRIVRFVERTGSDNETYRLPVIQYTDHFERVQTFEGLYSGFGDGKIGDEVRVRYDPRNNARAQWADQPGRGFWIVFFGLGVGAWLVLLTIWFLRRRAGRRAGAG